jgi:hypothetical protein
LKSTQQAVDLSGFGAADVPAVAQWRPEHQVTRTSIRPIWPAEDITVSAAARPVPATAVDPSPRSGRFDLHFNEYTEN